jgi:Zn finger protein HypA/HybF involved in hydrogenase expression
VSREPREGKSAEQISEIAEREERSAMEVEDASRYCPVCSQRLEARRCKLICPVCGYYMSCADYY